MNNNEKFKETIIRATDRLLEELKENPDNLVNYDLLLKKYNKVLKENILLKKENKKLQDKLDKINEYSNRIVKIVKQQPSKDKEIDNYFIDKLQDIQKIINEE